MSTTETDLREGYPSLVDQIREFKELVSEGESRVPGRVSRRMLPFSLAGFSEFALSSRCELERSGDLLVWIVCAVKAKAKRSRPVELRYGIEISKLGDVQKERARSERKLKKLAEAHLRAQLHILKFDLAVPTTGGVTLLDEKGRLLDS